MNRIRRWTTQITSSLDWMISQVENHEGLVGAAIKEVQDAGARANVQLKRMQGDGQQMRRKLLSLREQSNVWRERAKECAAHDEEKALECLRRAKRFDSEIPELESRERQHKALEQQLSKDLELIEKKLVALKQQRNSFRTRESRAEALALLQREEGVVISEIDEIFERWDHKIAKAEYGNSLVHNEGDPLEEAFVTAEERSTLKAELDALRAGNS